MDCQKQFYDACENGYLNVIKYLLTKIKFTNEIIKILCINTCEYFDEIKRYIKNTNMM